MGELSRTYIKIRFYSYSLNGVPTALCTKVFLGIVSIRLRGFGFWIVVCFYREKLPDDVTNPKYKYLEDIHDLIGDLEGNCDLFFNLLEIRN